jgi:hypothetical protein
MCRNNLSRSDVGNVRIASSISRAVLINAYDTIGHRAGKGDEHANRAHPFSLCITSVSSLLSGIRNTACGDAAG